MKLRAGCSQIDIGATETEEQREEERRGETEETDPHTEKWHRQKRDKREEDNEEKPPLMEGIGGEGGVVPVAAVGS